MTSQLLPASYKTSSEPPQAAFFALPNVEFLESGHYRALDVERKEIRVLKFLPSSTESDLQLELVERHLSLLEDAPPFTALSYAAGDLGRTASVRINGIAFETFQTLESVLRRLYFDFKDRLFWADQICINQHDLLEKSSQVLLMGDIYRTASSTLIHLGQFDTSDRIHQLVNAIWSGAEFLPNPLPPDVTWSDYDEDDAEVWQEVDKFARGPLAQILRDVSAADGFRDLAELFGRNWWSRSWCQQELVLSREPLILFGNNHILWRQLERIFEILKELPSWMEEPSEDAPSEHKLDYEIFLSWRAMLDTIGYTRYQNLMYRRSYNLDFGGSDLSQLLKGTRSLLSTDLRDRIYALLGLTTKDYRIQPNYHPSYTFNEALIDAYKAVITTEGNLAAIIEADTWRLDKSPGLPSWVPDLTKPEDEHMDALISNSTHGLPQNISLGESVEQNRLCHCLEVNIMAIGAPFDNTTLFVNTDRTSDTSLRQSIDSWIAFLQSNSLTQNNDESTIQEFCKSVSFGNPWQIEALTNYLANYSDFLEVFDIFDYQSRTRTLPSLWTIFCMPTPGTDAVVSYNTAPLIGLAPIQTLPGDQLCLIPTVSVPVVLRPSSITIKGLRTYTVVGRAYSPRYKNQEAATEELEAGVLKYERVCLI